MSKEENIKKEDEQLTQETPEEKEEGGLKVKTNIKAGPEAVISE